MKNTWIKKECLNCKKSFLKERSQCVERVKHGKKYTSGQYCSRKCFIEYFKKNFKPTLGKTWVHTDDYKKRLSEGRKGSKNPAYVHGAYSGKQRRGIQPPQIRWRREIFKRDYYTCQICGAKNGNGKTTNLQAHHICPWGLFPKLRFKLSNGITLCVACHRLVHREYILKAKQESVQTNLLYYQKTLESLEAKLKLTN